MVLFKRKLFNFALYSLQSIKKLQIFSRFRSYRLWISSTFFFRTKSSSSLFTKSRLVLKLSSFLGIFSTPPLEYLYLQKIRIFLKIFQLHNKLFYYQKISPATFGGMGTFWSRALRVAHIAHKLKRVWATRLLHSALTFVYLFFANIQVHFS